MLDVFMVSKRNSSNNGQTKLIMEAAGMGSIHGIVLHYHEYVGFQWNLTKVIHFNSLEG